MQEDYLFILPITEKSTNTFCGQNSNAYNVQTSVHMSYQCTWSGKTSIRRQKRRHSCG